MSGSNTQGVTVTYATADGSAKAGTDYVSTSGTVSWGAGDTSTKTIDVTVYGITVAEPNKTFFVNLSNPSNATISKSQGVGTIQGGAVSQDTIGLFAPNVVPTFLLRNTNGVLVADLMFPFGPASSGWKPIVGDWNADFVTTIGLYNPTLSTFFLRNSNTASAADITFKYGPAAAGWLPIAGDWNGDGTDTIGLYNPASSTFFLRETNTPGEADITFNFGPGRGRMAAHCGRLEWGRHRHHRAV